MFILIYNVFKFILSRLNLWLLYIFLDKDHKCTLDYFFTHVQVQKILILTPNMYVRIDIPNPFALRLNIIDYPTPLSFFIKRDQPLCSLVSTARKEEREKDS